MRFSIWALSASSVAAARHSILLTRHENAVPSQGRERALASGTGILANCQDVEFTGSLSVGTPPQDFTVLFDSGSSDLWVTSSDCTQGCSPKITKYASSKSSTFKLIGDAVTLQYADGSTTSGVSAEDVLHVDNQTARVVFAEMTKRHVSGCGRDGLDGIFGLGFQEVSAIAAPTAISTLVSEGHLDAPVVGFYLGSIKAPGDNTNEGNNGFTTKGHGVMTLGGVDSNYYQGCLRWNKVAAGSQHPAKTKGYWRLPLNGVSVGGKALQGGTGGVDTAIIDTGTSFLTGPFDAIGLIAAELGATCLAQQGTRNVVVDCVKYASYVSLIMVKCDSTPPTVTFTLGDYNFDMRKQDLLIPGKAILVSSDSSSSTDSLDNVCVVGMSGLNVPFWIFGDTFLRSHYVAFDYGQNRVGLARATANRNRAPCESDAHLAG